MEADISLVERRGGRSVKKRDAPKMVIEKDIKGLIRKRLSSEKEQKQALGN